MEEKVEKPEEGKNKKASTALRKRGLLFVKENVQERWFYLDPVDRTITRSDEHYKAIFKKAGL